MRFEFSTDNCLDSARLDRAVEELIPIQLRRQHGWTSRNSNANRIAIAGPIKREVVACVRSCNEPDVDPYDSRDKIEFTSQEHQPFVSGYLRVVADLDSAVRRNRIESP